MDVGPTGFGDDYAGFDMLLFLNLTSGALNEPTLGIDPGGTQTGFLTALLQGGFANDALFGGRGDQVLSALDPFAVYGTLIPENGTIFNASVFGFGISGVSLGVGEVAYVTTPAVPEPGTLVLFWIGLAGLRLMRRRRSR